MACPSGPVRVISVIISGLPYYAWRKSVKRLSLNEAVNLALCMHTLWTLLGKLARPYTVLVHQQAARLRYPKNLRQDLGPYQMLYEQFHAIRLIS